MSEKAEIPEKPVKKSAIMTEEKKKQLALARQKAEEIAHQNRLVRQKEQEAKELEKKIRAEKAEQALQSAKAKANEVQSKQYVPLAKQSVSHVSDDDNDEPIIIKTKKKPKKKVVYIDDSSSDSDNEIVYVKKKHRKPIEQIESKPVPPPDYNELMTNAQLKHEVALMKREMLRKSMFKA